MENFRLKVFRSVAERLSFTQAADALHLTQPAVTLQIRTLEESLGVRLFDRGGAGVSLTQAGHVLLGHVRRIDEIAAEAQRELGALTGEERGRLALGASTTIAQYILPPLLGRFLLANPRLEPFLIGANTEEIVNAVAEKRVALGLIEGPPHRTDLRTSRFLDDEIVAVSSPGREPLAGAAELEAHPLILRERGSGTRDVVERALRKAGLRMSRLKIAMELDSSEAIKSAVEAGLGIGFVSRWALRKELQLGTLEIVPIPALRIARRLNFLSAQGPEPDGAAGAFLRFAREHARQLRPF